MRQKTKNRLSSASRFAYFFTVFLVVLVLIALVFWSPTEVVNVTPA